MTNRPPKIVLFEGVHAVAAEMLRGRGLTVENRHGALCAGTDPGLDAGAGGEDLEGVAILGIRSKSRVDDERLASLPDLLGVACFCIGTNQVDLEAACRRGVAVFNAPFSNTRSVAEMTMAEVIALHRRLFEKSTLLHSGRWDKSADHAHEVRGRTLGIVGYGHIGSQVSVLAEALGMRVIYYDVEPKLALGNARAVDSLDELLEAADAVTLHVPATASTDGLIGRAQLARMRRGAVLINNARGSVVDLPALAEALRDGRLDGAAADVFPDEPTGRDEPFACPLAGLPNVILTPHVGGSTEEAQENIARDVATKLIRYLENGTTTSAINVPAVELPQLRPNEHRILHIHHNVPGVLSKISGLLGTLGVNINAEHLQSNAEVSYVILDVDANHGEAVRRGLAEIPETIRVRMVY